MVSPPSRIQCVQIDAKRLGSLKNLQHDLHKNKNKKFIKSKKNNSMVHSTTADTYTQSMWNVAICRLSHDENYTTYTDVIHACKIVYTICVYYMCIWIYIEVCLETKVWKHDKRLILKMFVMYAKWAQMWIDGEAHVLHVCLICVRVCCATYTHCGDICKRCNPLGNAIMMLQKISIMFQQIQLYTHNVYIYIYVSVHVLFVCSLVFSSIL